MSQDAAYFCPVCVSASVTYSELAGGTAACKACGWTGTREELAAAPVMHGFLSQEDMLKQFITQLASVLARTAAQPIGRLLLHWGFMESTHISSELPVYLKAIAAGATRAVIEVREELEKKRMINTRGPDNAA